MFEEMIRIELNLKKEQEGKPEIQVLQTEDKNKFNPCAR